MTPEATPDTQPQAPPQRWWQRCRWEIIGSAYTPPTGGFAGGEARGYDADRLLTLYEQSLRGFTTISMRCVLCGDIRTRVESGKAVLDG